MNTNEYMAACGLPEWLGALWVCEVAFDADGTATFNVENLATVLWTNEIHAARGWHSGFVPFGFFRTAEEAHAACDRMRRKQKVLRQLTDDEGIGTICDRVMADIDARMDARRQRRQPDHKARVIQAVADYQRRRGVRPTAASALPVMQRGSRPERHGRPTSGNGR